METNSAGNRQVAWRVLALVDALLLAYVIWHLPWGMLQTSKVQGDYAILAKPFTIAFDLAWNGLAAAFAACVGYGIAREIRGTWHPARWAALAASLPLVAGVALAAWSAYYQLGRIFDVMPLPDRLVVYDALAYPDAQGATTGARIAWIAAAAYLGEKYLLRWWNLRWPISLAAIAMLAWPVAVAWNGEARQKSWLEAQQWRSIGDGKTWVQAVEACRALGPGWRLPRPSELPIYVASDPEALHGARGKLWTATTFDMGGSAVVIDLQPRLRGLWRSNETPHRDQSTCELDANRHVAATDWFASLRPRLCESGYLGESVFVSTEQRIAYVRGTRATPEGVEYLAAETNAAVVCMKPNGEELGKSHRRAYPRQGEYPDEAAFRAAMRAACNPRQAGSDVAACAAFGRQEPATKATAG